MKYFLLLPVIFLSAATVITSPPTNTPAAATAERSNFYPALTPEQKESFENQMRALIKDQEKKVSDLKNKVMNRANMPSDASRMELQNAFIMLDVKKTIVNNFVNTPSEQSPVIRDFLLKLLKKDTIEVNDLAELQNLVQQERSKVTPQ